MDDKNNSVASTLKILGIAAMIVGVISGFYYGVSDEFYELGDLQGIIGWTLFINGLIWGIVFLGFAEVIKLLQGIYNQRAAKTSKEEVAASTETIEEELVPVLSDSSRNEILAFYSSKGQTVENIKLTSKSDFYTVEVDGQRQFIELGGFKPIIVSNERAQKLGLI